MASVTDFDLELIGSVKSLRILDLGGTKVTDLGLAQIVTSPSSNSWTFPYRRNLSRHRAAV